MSMIDEKTPATLPHPGRKAPNARFWDHVNGSYVKITLRPGQSLSWSRGWTHEEGWTSEAVRWMHTGDGVLCLMDCDGTDCDGRLATHSESFAPLDKLQEPREHSLPDSEHLPVPLWESLNASQRDYSAERAGY